MRLIDKVTKEIGEDKMQQDFTNTLCLLTQSDGKWYGEHFNYFREIVDDYLEIVSPHEPYKDFRQLFLELVRYYMEKDLLKFVDCEVGIELIRYIDKEGCHCTDSTKKIQWKGSTASIDETITLFNKYMPTGDEEGFNETDWMDDFFYCTCPQASFWYDGSDPDFPEVEPQWMDSD